MGTAPFELKTSYFVLVLVEQYMYVGHLRHAMVIFVFFTQCTTSFSALCRGICRYWPSIMLVRCILSSVYLRLSQLSFVKCIGLYGAVYIFSWPIYLMMIVRICIFHLVIIIKSEVWPICHCLGSGPETMICVECLSLFFWHNPQESPTTIF